jgi:hypothetical protein
VDADDLASGGSVFGSTSNDTLVGHGTVLDLTGTTLTSVEILQAGSSLATHFIIDQADLSTGGGSVVGSSGNDTLEVNGASLNLSSTTLTSVEILQAHTTNATTFTVDQADLASGGSVIGEASSDTLVVNGNSVNLSSTTLTSIETIKTANASNSTTFTLSNGEGGATVDLTVNGKSDTIDLAAAYKLGNVTDSAEIAKHVITVDHFLDGTANLDIIDVSHVANGTVSAVNDITGFINLANPATLKDALDIAAVADGHTNSSVVSFQFGGDTYVLIDKSAESTVTADDAVIKLTGTHTLTNGNFDFVP